MSDIKPIITSKLLIEYLTNAKNLSSEDIKKVNSIFISADEYDLNGKKVEEPEVIDGYTISNGDGILNDDEQSNFMDKLEEKMPNIYSLLKNFFTEQNSKSNQEILADNIMAMGYSPILLRQTLDNLNNENLMEVAKICNHKGIDTLFFTIYQDAKMCEFESKGITAHVIEKLKGYAKCMLNIAKQENIYCNDYDEEIQKLLASNEFENFVYTLDNLQSRIFVETDYNKTLNASKRKLELKEPNGTIDENFVQGYTGNCWFISSIKSICNNKKLLDKLNKMITIEKENDKITAVKVNIQENVYKIDYKKLKNANEYSSGDLDVRALEIAANEYMHDNNLGDINKGNSPVRAYKILFGENNVAYKDDYTADEYINTLKQDNAGVISILTCGYQGGKAYDENNQIVQLTPNHAFSYNHIDSEFIYFFDPHNKNLHVPIAELSNNFDIFSTVRINL